MRLEGNDRDGKLERRRKGRGVVSEWEGVRGGGQSTVGGLCTLNGRSQGRLQRCKCDGGAGGLADRVEWMGKERLVKSTTGKLAVYFQTALDMLIYEQV